ncbi:EAL domain-containing protein [Sphingosinicella sp. BN140058]|uniref:EAL domain-containing protein n=1 Tax=Sphingosinicella sp. BN140058 TaxID=1892855 RepID=UPI0013EDE5BB|nr:EAL domain-containing protein [Sphingosinicella sp. BN140058]
MTLAVAAGIGLLALFTGAGAGLEETLQDVRYGLRSHPASGEIVVVEIDARSIKRIARWPWPRSVHARLVDRLRHAGARTIAFDVDFSSPTEPKEDAALAAALDRAGGGVIISTFRQAAGSGAEGFVDNLPIKMLADRAFLGAVNVQPDDDGEVRSMLLGVETADTPRPSLPSLIAGASAAIGQDFPIDYAIDPATVPRLSLIDVLDGKVPAAAIRGKKIMIGATAIEIWDRYTTPRHGVLPGVVIQAVAAESLIGGRVPQRWSGALPWLAALAIVALLGGGRKPRHLALMAAAGLLLLLLPLITEQKFALTLAVVPGLLTLACGIAFTCVALAADRAQRRARHDPGTGLPNLSALEAAMSSRAGANLIVAHIENFTILASSLGSDAVAQLIVRVSNRLRCSCAQGPIYRIDTATLAWIERTEDETSLDGRLEEAAALMRTPIEIDRPVEVSLTFGLSAAGAPRSPRQRVADADLAALNAARRGGRWQKFTEADGEEASWQLSLLAELDQALASGDLWNAYQPKLDIASGRIVGVEALVRWNHRERGPIGPDRFIPVIEANGRAGDLTIHVLRQALDDARSWADQGHPIGIAVNVSATLLADHGFIETVRGTLSNGIAAADRVTIEVTESAAMLDPERAVAALESWRALGVNISIDDYGTGQSSLGYLQRLPATELKIDKSFVQTIAQDRRNAIMVRSTIAMAHELGMKVVAEGIEDGECLRLLGEMQCDTAQGFYIARPLTAGALAAFLHDRDKLAA